MIRSFLFALVALFLAPASYAACTGPAGDAGDIRYNEDYAAMQRCDGADWIGFPKHGPAVCNNGDDVCTGFQIPAEGIPLAQEPPLYLPRIGGIPTPVCLICDEEME